MSQQARRDSHVALRRDLHRHPEPAWCEYYTTARIVDELERVGADERYVGPAAIDPAERTGVPDEETHQTWMGRARTDGAREDVLERTAGGHTGAVAVLRRGDGPTVGLRVDIDALPITEGDDGHVPAAEGFRSEREGWMHACGHDAHAAIGVGVLQAVADADFAGTLKVFFQPAEERIGGGKAMAEGGHLDDVDYLLAVHVGMEHPTGEVVAGIDGFLAVSQFRAAYAGESSHAGLKPEAGRNAVQAVGTAVQNLYAIPRHADGSTRVNAGRIGGGTATNVIAEEAFVEGEVRGETTELRDYVRERAERVLRTAAETHGCKVEITAQGAAPSAVSDQGLVDVVHGVAADHDDVDSALERDTISGSEDATLLMRAVQDGGGLATYVGIGTDHPTGHHTPTFDVDEDSIPIGVDVLANAVLEIADRKPGQ